MSRQSKSVVWSNRDRSVLFVPSSSSIYDGISECLGHNRKSLLFRRAFAHFNEELQKHSGSVFRGMFVIPKELHEDCRKAQKLSILSKAGIYNRFSVRHIGNHAYYSLYSVCSWGD